MRLLITAHCRPDTQTLQAKHAGTACHLTMTNAKPTSAAHIRQQPGRACTCLLSHTHAQMHHHHVRRVHASGHSGMLDLARMTTTCTRALPCTCMHAMYMHIVHCACRARCAASQWATCLRQVLPPKLAREPPDASSSHVSCTPAPKCTSACTAKTSQCSC